MLASSGSLVRDHSEGRSGRFRSRWATDVSVVVRSPYADAQARVALKNTALVAVNAKINANAGPGEHTAILSSSNKGKGWPLELSPLL